MIYLFNSAFSPLYAVNIMNTLFLPSGTCNTYRYRYQGSGNIQVCPTLIANLKQLGKEKDCLIIFIDRFAPQGYEFIPLRKAKLADIFLDQDRCHFKVILGDYVFPTDLSSFNRDIVQTLQPKRLPALTAGDPQNTNDGYYAIQEKDFLRNDSLITGDGAWTPAVDSLSQRKAFSDAIDPVFVKARLLSGDKALRPSWRNHCFLLSTGKHYEIEISYRYPKQIRDHSARNVVDVILSDNIKAVSSSQIDVCSVSNRVAVSVATKRYPEETKGFFYLKGDDKTLIAKSNIEILISDGLSFWIQVGLALAIFSVASFYLGIDISKLQQMPDSIQMCPPSPTPKAGIIGTFWPKLVAQIAETIALFWLFRLFGKKPI